MSRYQLSVSKLKLFQTCQYQFYLKYIKKIKPKEIGNALILGSAVHNTLEKYTQSQGAIDISKYFKDEYDSLKSKNEHKGLKIIYSEWDSYQQDIERGNNMLKNYLSKTKDDNQESILYAEVPFRVNVQGINDAVLIGFIDGVTDQGMTLLEYKTTKAHPEKWFIDNDLQMMGYAYAIKNGQPIYSMFDPRVDQELTHLFGSLPERVKYIALHALYDNKKPWHVNGLTHTYLPTDNGMIKFENEVKCIWENIKWCGKNNYWSKSIKDPTTTPCKMCSFRNECFSGGNHE